MQKVSLLPSNNFFTKEDELGVFPDIIYKSPSFLGMQKASLAFEATLQVRNKVLKAYEDILNMPV